MELHNNRPVKKRRNSVQIKHLLEEFDNSNKNIPEFCSVHGICRATFHKWCSRYKIKADKVNEPNGFSILQVTSPVQEANTLFAEVHGIKIYQLVTASYLKELAKL